MHELLDFARERENCNIYFGTFSLLLLFHFVLFSPFFYGLKTFIVSG